MSAEKHTQRLLDLQVLLYEFMDIERMIYMRDGAKKDRRETDTEHSYHLAMMVWYLCGAFPKLDRDKAIRYAIAHDIVEIHAGDVMAVGRTAEQQATKDKREAAAIVKLKEDWPDFKDLTDTIEAYEQQDDPEAIFVKAFDKITPIVHNILAEGRTWKLHNIDRRTVIDLKDDKTKPSQEVTELWQIMRGVLEEHDEFFNEDKRN